MGDYTISPCKNQGSFESIDSARNRLAWWLSSNGMMQGTVNSAGKLVGKVVRDTEYGWLWLPAHKRTAYILNPRNGTTGSQIKGGRNRD